MADDFQAVFVRCDASYDSDAVVSGNHSAHLHPEAVEVFVAMLLATN